MEKYPELENLVKIAKILDELNIPYYITGGFAVTIYGRPRFTADVDIVIKMDLSDITEFANQVRQIFPKGYVDKYQIEQALKLNSEFNIIDTESGFKFDFFITKNDGFEESAFKRYRVENLDAPIKTISPEDLIISKLLWFRESESTRQIEDIISVMDIQKNLDQKYIDSWIEKLSLQNEWQKLQELKR